MTRISKLLLPNPQKFMMLLLSPKGSKAFCRVFPPLSFHTMHTAKFVCIFLQKRAYIAGFKETAQRKNARRTASVKSFRLFAIKPRG